MGKLRAIWRTVFDVREGERLRTLFMFLYLFSTLLSYYILKPASRGMFLSKFKVDDLPVLNILLAAAGGVFAYLYTKLAVRTSLRSAVGWATTLTVASLGLIWWLLGRRYPWMLYVFNIWVSMFSIVMVTQCWLVAANVFNSREAKRVYTLLGVGAVVGAFFGGTFTNFMLRHVKATQDLIWWSLAWVLVAYLFFRLAVAQQGVSLAQARAADTREAEFSLRDILGPLFRHRHLQVIIAITFIMLMVDVIVEFQLQSVLKQTYESEKQITAFLALYTGTYLNLVNFVSQFFLTALVVRLFGVGGTLQIMPVSIAAASVTSLAWPSLVATTGARMVEATTRYTLNRTGMELLYLPLPLELRNRTKAFIDIFVDRFGRGVGGAFMLVLVNLPFTEDGENIRPFAILVLALTAVWILLAWRAQREYVVTVRKRIESRRLDIESIRLGVQDPVTIALLEQTADSPNARQAAYALSLLSEAPDYNLQPLLERLAARREPEVRARVFELAREVACAGLLDAALKEVRSSRAPDRSAAIKPAVAYAVAVSPEGPALAARLLDHPNPLVSEAAVEALGASPEAASEHITHGWLDTTSADTRPERRRLAALAVGVRGDAGTEALYGLLEDPHPLVAQAACRAAGALQNRGYLEPMIRRLTDPRVRGAAIDALAAFGARIVGTLGDLLRDGKLPVALRRQAPRVLRLIPVQRSVDTLIESLGEPNLEIRSAVLRALNRLRETAPALDYGAAAVSRRILDEARGYLELRAALAPFRDRKDPRAATGLLAATIEQRLSASIDRLFRLLGLRYPPKDIYAAYLALTRRRADEHAAALDFLDNVLDRDAKRVVLPLLDESGLAATARDLFGIQEKNAETALRELISSGDEWLAACAIAAAAELGLRSLAPEIRAAAQGAGGHVSLVAQSAAAVLS